RPVKGSNSRLSMSPISVERSQIVCSWATECRSGLRCSSATLSASLCSIGWCRGLPDASAGGSRRKARRSRASISSAPEPWSDLYRVSPRVCLVFELAIGALVTGSIRASDNAEDWVLQASREVADRYRAVQCHRQVSERVGRVGGPVVHGGGLGHLELVVLARAIELQGLDAARASACIEPAFRKEYANG